MICGFRGEVLLFRQHDRVAFRAVSLFAEHQKGDGSQDTNQCETESNTDADSDLCALRHAILCGDYSSSWSRCAAGCCSAFGWTTWVFRWNRCRDSGVIGGGGDGGGSGGVNRIGGDIEVEGKEAILPTGRTQAEGEDV